MAFEFFPFKKEFSAELLLRLRSLYFLLLGLILAFTLRTELWGEVDPAFWMPVSLYKIFPSPPFGAGVLLTARLAFLGLCFVSAFIRNPLVSILTLLTGFLSLSYGFNFGKMDHYYHMAAIILLADFLAILAERRSGQKLLCLEWQFRFVQFAIAALYFSTAARKLSASGLDWALSDNMRIMLLDHGRPLGQWLAGQGILPKLLALGALGLEFFSPLVLFFPALLCFFLPSWCLMHLSIYFCMGPNFLAHGIALLFFLPLFRKGSVLCLADLLPRKRAFSFASFAVYGLISGQQVIFGHESWPFSSYPMYEQSWVKGTLQRYRLYDESNSPVSLDQFPPFPAATLERSLRKSGERERTEQLFQKISFLNGHYSLGKKRLILRREEWTDFSRFDAGKSERQTDLIVYQAPSGGGSGD